MDRLRTALTLLALFAFVGFGALILLQRTKDPLAFNPSSSNHHVEARVVRFGTIPSKWQADKLVVVAATIDGRSGEGVIALERVTSNECKVGDPVTAHMDGAALVVDASTCGEFKK